MLLLRPKGSTILSNDINNDDFVSKSLSFLICRRSVRQKRQVSVPEHLFLTNVCKEETNTIDLQKHFKSADIFNPAKIVSVRCIQSKTFQRQVFQKCANSPLAICKTKLRMVHFTRQPRNGDCRHMTQRHMRVPVSCECRQFRLE